MIKLYNGKIFMTIVRNYDEVTDSQAVGVLIAKTYRKFNLDFASPAEQEQLLGPFFYAGSAETSHQEAIRLDPSNAGAYVRRGLAHDEREHRRENDGRTRQPEHLAPARPEAPPGSCPERCPAR